VFSTAATFYHLREVPVTSPLHTYHPFLTMRSNAPGKYS